jgi:hypothetical protein
MPALIQAVYYGAADQARTSGYDNHVLIPPSDASTCYRMITERNGAVKL